MDGDRADTVASSEELKRRRDFLDKMRILRSEKPARPGPFPSTEEMQREDRER